MVLKRNYIKVISLIWIKDAAEYRKYLSEHEPGIDYNITVEKPASLEEVAQWRPFCNLISLFSSISNDQESYQALGRIIGVITIKIPLIH